MDLQLAGLRVLVTAGAGGIGLEIVRAFRREGARVHACDVDEAALRALAEADPEVTRSTTDVADRRGGGGPLRRRPSGARRARLPRQQCRHRRADGTGRGSRPRRMGPLPRSRHHGPVQLHAPRRAASEAEPQRQHRQHLVGGREIRLPPAHAVCGGEMGRDRLHQVPRHGARRIRHPRQRRPARRRRRRTAGPRPRAPRRRRAASPSPSRSAALSPRPRSRR